MTSLAVMETRQSSVRKNIALKLKDASAQKATDAKKKKERESEEVGISMDGDKSSTSLQPSSTVTGSKRNLNLGSSGVRSAQELKWDHRVNFVGRAVQDPLLHICEICSLPVLIYGRMKRCRHAFCRDCAKKAAGVCPKCKEGDQIFEEASMGNVYICTHGGGRYDNKGCGRSYLSQRDLEAHITYRHKEKVILPPSIGTSSGNPIPSFPIFFQSARPELTMPPTGLPPAFPTGAVLAPGSLPPPPPIAPAAAQGLRPPIVPPNPLSSVPQFVVTQGNPSLTTSISAPIVTNWTRPPAFK